MRRHSVLFLLVIVMGALVACQGGEKGRRQSLTVFCGSASKPAMEEIAPRFEAETGTGVNMIFGGSGTLLSQMELSRQGEIYLPGSPDYIIIGERKKLLVEDSERIVAYLVPAIITPAGNPAGIRSLEDLTRPGVRIGIGNPETVCLGLYGIELLESNHLLVPVMKNVVTFGASCSRTANLAALGKVDAVLGWRVFHFWNESRMEFVPIAGDRIPRISYIPIAVPVFSKNFEVSQRFIDFVLSPFGRGVYEKHGYLSSLERAKDLAPRARVGGEYSLPTEYFDLLE